MGGKEKNMLNNVIDFLAKVCSKLVEQFIYTFSILPRLGIRRKIFSCPKENKIVLIESFKVSLNPNEELFLSFCKKDNPIYEEYYQQDIFYCNLKNVLFYGDSSGIYVKETKKVLLDSLMDYSSYIHTRISNPLTFVKKIKKKGIFTSIDHFPWTKNNHYHWLCECIPRLYILEKINENFEQLNLIISEELSDKQREMLFPFIYDKEFITVSTIPRYEAWEIDHFIFLSFVTQPGSGYIPKQIIEFIQNKFFAYYQIRKTTNHRKIYISRKIARNRKILNEDSIIPILVKKGFEIVFLEKMSIKDQIQLFFESEVIIGPHGAGFSNIIFCQKNTKVLELFSSDNVRSFFFFLSKSNELNYDYLICEKSDKNENFNVDIYSFDKKLEKLGII